MTDSDRSAPALAVTAYGRPARFEVIEDCGHMAPLEKPHELAALLARWIETASPA